MNEEKLDKIIKMAMKTLESNGYSLSKYESVEVLKKGNNLMLFFSNFYDTSMLFRVVIIKDNGKYYVEVNRRKYELKEVGKNE